MQCNFKSPANLFFENRYKMVLLFLRKMEKKHGQNDKISISVGSIYRSHWLTFNKTRSYHEFKPFF
jgi:hypothetical protein